MGVLPFRGRVDRQHRRLTPSPVDDYSGQLVDAIDGVIAEWVERNIRRVASLQRLELPPDADRRIAEAALATRREVNASLRALLALDVDEQRGNPLDVLRRSVTHSTTVLRELGARPVDRDEFSARVFPDDVYALGPAAFADVHESLIEPGIIWGAWKAKTVLDRRRSEGRLPPSGS